MRKAFWVPSKNPIRKFGKKLWPFPLKSKKQKKVFLYILISIGVILLGGLAWISKDLPTPGRIKSHRSAESTQITDRNGNLLYAIYGNQKRISLKYNEIPDSVKNATIAAEDANFYHHHGIDFRGVARALYNDVFRRSKYLQGGSTITQQYVKNALLYPKRTLIRKIKEAILAIELEIMFSKDEIVTMYLNEIPYGSNAYGVEAASQTYFDKNAKDLTLAESAILAAMTRAPSYYSPYGGHSDELLKRKNYVLDRMVNLKMISKEDATKAKKQKIVFARRKENIIAPHFVMYVKEVLAAKYGDQIVEEGGLKVTTTLDPDKQKIAEEVIEQESKKVLSHSGASNAGIVSIDPKNGQILAMVGSIDYFNLENQGNVNVTIAKRSPGSSFKPIVYATAFKDKWSPASTLFDLTTDFGGGYTPDNYNGRTSGPVSIRHALANSLNIPAVKMLYLAGMNNSLNTAHEMGITTLNDPDRYGLSLVLGGGEIKLLELTGAYSVFANQGSKFDVSPILKVTDSRGKVLEEKKDTKPKQILDSQIAYEISSILSDNQARSPMFGSRSALYFPDRTVAAKTGTAQNYRDAWTVGYTPSLVTGVWVGNNDNSPMYNNGAGAMAAAPLWHSFMEKSLSGKPNEDFAKPQGIQDATVDALTGLLPGKTSPLGLRTDIFASWQLPKDRADLYTTATIDMSCGDKLATDLTPPSLKKEVTFANIHSEVPDKPNWEGPVRAWAKSAGLGSLAPTEVCPIHTEANKPKIVITSPTAGANVSGGTTIKVSVTAPNGVSKVQYYIDDIYVGSRASSPFSFTYDMNSLSAGSHKIKAEIIDRGDYSATHSIEVTVAPDSSPPGEVSGVSITPGPGAGQITLTWTNPSDADFSGTNIYKSTDAGFIPSVANRYTKTSNHQITITGLISGQTYYFVFRPVDYSNNENSNSNKYSGQAL
ncbi:MAG TPA: PBP1A family penicillin-binding protein [Patescibacteria group bacterium]|nr:PBP1A family penicillin-binding protein [Patescibacteria group bacterium]